MKIINTLHIIKVFIIIFIVNEWLRTFLHVVIGIVIPTLPII